MAEKEQDEEISIPPYVRCRDCKRQLNAPDFLLAANPTVGEQYAFWSQVAESKGWGHGSDHIDGEFVGVFLCPEHVRQSPQAMERELPRYSNHAICAACGYDKLDVRHCKGLISTCELGAPRNHLHRTCQRCSWSWIEGRKDDAKAKEQPNVSSPV